MDSSAPNTSGIYQIVNTVNGKVYVGRSRNIEQRFGYHRHFLREGRHDNQHLQKSWNRYGADAFKFMVVESVPVELLQTKEQTWLDAVFATSEPYNIHTLANSPAGKPVSDVTREKRRVNMMGNKNRLGQAVSEETKAKMSEAHRGNQRAKGKHWALSDETKERMKAAWIRRKAKALEVSNEK